jgi:hypothetical protein
MVISTLLDVQTIESAVTEIWVFGVKPKLVLPRKSRPSFPLSKARISGECCATTAANARAVGPDAVTDCASAARGAAIARTAIPTNLIMMNQAKSLSLIGENPTRTHSKSPLIPNQSRNFPSQIRTISPHFCSCANFKPHR